MSKRASSGTSATSTQQLALVPVEIDAKLRVLQSGRAGAKAARTPAKGQMSAHRRYVTRSMKSTPGKEKNEKGRRRQNQYAEEEISISRYRMRNVIPLAPQ
jgi:hypothetical protein